MTKDIKSHPELSIVIPSFNDSLELEHALQSILALGLSSIEVIVQDGAKSNQTKQVCARFSSSFSLLYVDESDFGIYDAIKKGIEKATSNWVLILGSDDRILPELTEMISSLLDSNCIYYGNVRYKQSKRVYDGIFTTEKLYLRNICQQAIIYPKNVISQIDSFSESPLFADYLLNILFWINPKFRWEFVDKVIVEFNELGLSGKKKDEYFYKNHEFLKADLLKFGNFSLMKRFLLKWINRLNMFYNSVLRKV